MPSKNQRIPQQPPAHKTFAVEDVAQGVDQRMARTLASHTAEEALFTLAAIVESSDDAIFSRTLDGIVLSWNQGAERLYGYSAQEIIGQSISTLVPADRSPELADIMQRLREGQCVAHFETVRRRKDGRLIDVSITLSPVRDASGKVIAASTIARDSTERKQMQEQLRASEQRFRALIEKSSDAIVLLDMTGMLLYASPSTTRLLGYTPDELVGRSAFELIHPEDAGTIAHALAALVQEPGKGPKAEFRARHQNGSWRWFEGIGTNLLADPNVGAIVGNFRDITEHKRAGERQRLLNEASNVLVSSLDHQITLQEVAQLIVPALADYCRIALVDEQHQIKAITVHHIDPEKIALVRELYDHYKDRVHATHGVQKILHTGKPELISTISGDVLESVQHSPELLHIISALGLQSYMGVPLLARGKTIGAITFSSVQPHRSYTPEDLSFAQELARRIALVLENARLHQEAQAELAERKQAEERQRVLQERILALATTDPVTELPNHRALLARLDQELERARRYDRVCSLLFLDLDHFKALNDGYGHAAGDAVLGEFASLIRAQLRRMDTVGRWGGEEFVAILPELRADEALALAEEVRAAVAAHTFSVGGGLHLTCSIGMASCPTHAQEREGLLSAADHAMYGAKRFGRNQVRAAHDPAVLALFIESHPEQGREEAALVGMVEALVTLVEARDYSTGRHSQQVADLVLQLALALGLLPAEAQMIALASRLHDVGKVAVPDAVLQKPTRLTEEEWELMRTHPLVGADVVSHIPALRPLAPVIRAHHERWDGQGYPDHLKGEAIPLGARILTVVDAYVAMTVDRPYQHACVPAAALAELRRCAGSQFDPRVVEALTLLLRQPDQRCELLLRE
jgi:diguanylate cyclase (GGDEF)-like protein/PAS domain S-box-containing protein